MPDLTPMQAVAELRAALKALTDPYILKHWSRAGRNFMIEDVLARTETLAPEPCVRCEASGHDNCPPDYCEHERPTP